MPRALGSLSRGPLILFSAFSPAITKHVLCPICLVGLGDQPLHIEQGMFIPAEALDNIKRTQSGDSMYPTGQSPGTQNPI